VTPPLLSEEAALLDRAVWVLQRTQAHALLLAAQAGQLLTNTCSKHCTHTVIAYAHPCVFTFSERLLVAAPSAFPIV
jgi:hypothetical protein